MNDYTFYCNLKNCRVELSSRAWITVCFHIFCPKHGENIIRESKCSVCNTRINKSLDIIQQTLNPSEKYKWINMTGIHPDIGIKILQKSLNFWSYQVYYNKFIRDGELKLANERIIKLNDDLSNISMQHKTDFQRFVREIEALKNEKEETMMKMESLVQQLAEKSRIVREVEALKNEKEVLMQKIESLVQQLAEKSRIIRDFQNRYIMNHTAAVNYVTKSNNSSEEFIFFPSKKHVNLNFQFEKEENNGNSSFKFDL